jgi:hypothetical protein
MRRQPALERPSRRLSDQQLVELLRQPSCVGRALRTILDELELEHRRPFADHWDYICFVDKAGFQLDFIIRREVEQVGHYF